MSISVKSIIAIFEMPYRPGNLMGEDGFFRCYGDPPEDLFFRSHDYIDPLGF